MSKVWIITGSASGMGAGFARHATYLYPRAQIGQTRIVNTAHYPQGNKLIGRT
ncbi:hypothetical protein [Pseudomonas sp.]|uniref:hypothetical protein n=1 Tax=Pseudomonas sp. TaxID=306 RepID=UPI00261F0ADA|nr:hypothetical protein [Pseudomonas sp.]